MQVSNSPSAKAPSSNETPLNKRGAAALPDSGRAKDGDPKKNQILKKNHANDIEKSPIIARGAR